MTGARQIDMQAPWSSGEVRFGQKYILLTFGNEHLSMTNMAGNIEIDNMIARNLSRMASSTVMLDDFDQKELSWVKFRF